MCGVSGTGHKQKGTVRMRAEKRRIHDDIYLGLEKSLVSLLSLLDDIPIVIEHETISEGVVHPKVNDVGSR